MLRSGDGRDDGDEGGRSARERELDRARREALLAHELVGQRDRELQQAAAALASERATLGRQIDTANQALATQAFELAALQKGLLALRAEVDGERARTAAALRVIAEVESSASWRLTKPLRALNAALRARRSGQG